MQIKNADIVRAVVVAGCLAAAVYIVFGLKIGPVVATITQGHGVHSGDALALIPLAGAAAMLLIRGAR